MNEDDVYRTSTQFRFWTYTTRTLQDLREASNKLACTRVRDAIKRAQAKDNKSTDGSEIDCLTVEEEQKIIGWYCGKGIELCDFSGFPKAVKVSEESLSRLYFIADELFQTQLKNQCPRRLLFNS